MDYNTIMSIWFYDFENILEHYTKILEERNNEEERRAKEQGYDQKNMNPNDMMKSAKGMMPTMHKMPSLSFPKL